MRNTASVEKVLLFLTLCGIFCGCARLGSDILPPLCVTQHAVRARMLKLQTGELLAQTAKERYSPRLSSEVLAMANGYQGQSWSMENDPALQVLENAIAYGLVALSSAPAETAEKVSAALLDYNTAQRLLKLKKTPGNSDLAAELAMMTGWGSDKVRKYAGAPLPEIKISLFPVYSEAERELLEKGEAAAFHAAAAIYRLPSEAGLRHGERLRRALLNRYLMQTKSPGAETTPELRITYLRGRIFEKLLPSL